MVEDSCNVRQHCYTRLFHYLHKQHYILIPCDLKEGKDLNSCVCARLKT